MPKIYLFCYPYDEHDFAGLAIAEDGTLLAGHLSSSVDFSKHDMGFTSNWKHEAYKIHYPDGFDLEWVDDPNNHEGLASANKLRKAAQHHAHMTPSAMAWLLHLLARSLQNEFYGAGLAL